MSEIRRTRHLIDRLARLNAADVWMQELNPTQVEALSYLARANRFSRSPSHVADYLGSTRGTVSQTLKALTRKGLIAQEAHAKDKRSIQYGVTPAGDAILTRPNALEDGILTTDLEALNTALTQILQNLLAKNGGRSFGLCRTCKHHDPTGFCQLLKVDLTPIEADQICHEHINHDPPTAHIL